MKVSIGRGRWLVLGCSFAAGLVLGCDLVEDGGPSTNLVDRVAEVSEAEVDLDVAVADPNYDCIVGCAYEFAVCSDEALVRRAKCNGDTCVRDAHREHAADLLACKKAHPNDTAGLLACSQIADTKLMAALDKCPAVANKPACETEYQDDRTACQAAFDACVAGCPPAPAAS